MIEQRALGRTGLSVSALGFGCGAVGGLMVRGTADEQQRTVARAIEWGVNYFDTAADYGAGQSERNLGQVLRALRADVLVGTKVSLGNAERDRIGDAVVTALDQSLRRLGRDCVDLFQLHNPISDAGIAPDVTADMVLHEVVPALQKLQAAGKTRFIGITGIGDADALRQVLQAGVLDSAQMPYNLLNPSAVSALPPGSPTHDFKGMMHDAVAAGVGVIGIRVLAGGALSGEPGRHPTGVPDVTPIASGASYAADVARARHFLPLVEAGYVDSLVEAALRFAISTDAMSTVLIGMSTLAQFEVAAVSIAKGKLPPEALARVAELQRM
jgi:L-galactose dehydrogenase/L-glyceraldehyde 3-phosphate reductase